MDNKKGGFQPKIVGFLCHWCAYASADLAGTHRLSYPPNVRFIRVMCTGMVHPDMVLHALLKGLDGVLILGCHPGECHYHSGNLIAQERAHAVELALREYGISLKRFRLDWCSSGEAERFAGIIEEFVSDIKALGPNTLTMKGIGKGPLRQDTPIHSQFPTVRHFGSVAYYWDGIRYKKASSAQRALKRLLDRGFEVKLVPIKDLFLLYTRKDVREEQDAD